MDDRILEIFNLNGSTVTYLFDEITLDVRSNVPPVSEIKRLLGTVPWKKKRSSNSLRTVLELSNFGRNSEGGSEVREGKGRECIANVPRVPILETTPQGIQKPCDERGDASFQGEHRRKDREVDARGNYFRTVKPARDEGDVRRHLKVKGYLGEQYLKLISGCRPRKINIQVTSVYPYL